MPFINSKVTVKMSPEQKKELKKPFRMKQSRFIPGKRKAG